MDGLDREHLISGHEGGQAAGSATNNVSPISDILNIMNAEGRNKIGVAASTTTCGGVATTATQCISEPHSASSKFLSFVKGKHSHLSVLSSFISSSSYLLPSRFSDDDTTVEVTCALADFVSLFNDAVYYCHDGGAEAGGGDGMAVGGTGRVTRDILVLRACIAGLECVELAAEKVAALRSKETRGRVIATIEAAKAACRILLVVAAGGGTSWRGEEGSSQGSGRRRKRMLECGRGFTLV